MNEVTIGIIGVGVLFVLFLIGVEMAYAMAIVGFAGFCILGSVQGAMSMVAKDLFETFSSYGLLVIPLFLFMGQVAFNAGIAKRMYDAANRFLGNSRWGGSVQNNLWFCYCDKRNVRSSGRTRDEPVQV
jgi:C4-dicarboxylate transporter DctM subunit